ncbi:transmembrane protein 63B-like [Dorcoceras hygrometricum]|uniref:Transmembrane protein 63B-like n=1 Tax=Dorcoceras hygrometricum TaxID=472368 RepID=A0A2Z7C851_9LAMI|nr:transmembrane protein 63B-like [Dorcoceras hygrometricum]
MTFRVVRTNQYNQDLGLIHSTNGNHLEGPNEGSSIDHQVTIHLHAQNITMFPTNETWKVPLEEFDPQTQSDFGLTHYPNLNS